MLARRASKSRRLVVVGRRGVVQNGFVAGFSLDLSLDLAEVLLHLSQVVVGQHDRMPAVPARHEAMMQIRAGVSNARGARERLPSPIVGTYFVLRLIPRSTTAAPPAAKKPRVPETVLAIQPYKKEPSLHPHPIRNTASATNITETAIF